MKGNETNYARLGFLHTAGAAKRERLHSTTRSARWAWTGLRSWRSRTITGRMAARSMTADVRIRSVPPADEGCTFFPRLPFPLQPVILCFPLQTLTRAHSDAALPCRTSARARSAILFLRGGRTACPERGQHRRGCLARDVSKHGHPGVLGGAPPFPLVCYARALMDAYRASARRSIHHPTRRQVCFSSTLSPPSSPLFLHASAPADARTQRGDVSAQNLCAPALLKLVSARRTEIAGHAYGLNTTAARSGADAACVTWQHI
jgi:hypothetical protein